MESAVMSSDKEAALKLAMTAINKEFGKGSVSLPTDGPIPGIEKISTGSISLDLATGGGIPRGRIIEIYGPESSGKTTLALSIIANAQKEGGMAAFVDAEHAIDPEYAQALGVEIDRMVISQPDYGEQALDITDMLVRSGALDVIVIDSVAALTPQKELEGSMSDNHMGLQSRMMSMAMRKITAAAHNQGTTVIFINQIRMKIGVMFGNPETTSGGNALKFYASQRLDIRSAGKVKDGEEIIGNATKVKVIKNKVAPPFKIAEFVITFGKGINKSLDLLTVGVDKGIINKSGAWYSYEGERIGQGQANAASFLDENEAIKEKIRAACTP